MRAVWSLWTLPERRRSGWPWLNRRHQLLSWILSLETARRHFSDLALVTDDEGAELLADGLELPFTEVSTALNDLRDRDPDWWMFGKLYAYGLQRQPFVHVDSDVYLWKPLPQRVVSAPVFAQNPEDAGLGAPWYDTTAAERAIRNFGDGSIPAEWHWYSTSGTPQEAACCGILGGNDTGFLTRYSFTVMQLLQNPGNRLAFDSLGDKRTFNPLFEQYLLCACAKYHGVRIEYLFESFGQAISPGQAAEAGFTHLISSAKSNPDVARRLEQRVQSEYPESYERCLRLASLERWRLA